MAKRILCAIITFSLMFGCFLPARAVPVGAAEEELKDLYEMKYGYALDCVMIAVSPAERDRLLEKLQADAQVKSVGMVLCRLPSPDYFEKVKNGEAEFDQNDILIPHLNTSTKEALDAFIARYENEPGVVSIEYDGLGYIPESRFAVKLELTVFGSEGLLEPRTAFVPTDFSETLVKTVYVSARTGPGLTAEEKAVFDALPEKETLALGLPTQLILETPDGSPQAAASLALELIDFENSDLFSETQKAMFRERLIDVSVFSYDGISEEKPIESLVGRQMLRVWYSAKTENFLQKLIDAGVVEQDGCIVNYFPGVRDQYWGSLFIDLSQSKKSPEALADLLNAIPEARWFCIYNGVDYQAAYYKNALSEAYLDAAALLPGDLNGDGKLTSADARLALRAAVGLEFFSGTRWKAADTNGDGAVTAADARKLLRSAVGRDDPAALTYHLTEGERLLLGPFYWNDGGYVWSLSSDAAEGALAVTEISAEVAPPVLAPGGPGDPFFYSVEGLQAGVYRLQLTLQRPWESEALETFTVNLAVSEDTE